jgi:hypothetical protein
MSVCEAFQWAGDGRRREVREASIVRDVSPVDLWTEFPCD